MSARLFFSIHSDDPPDAPWRAALCEGNSANSEVANRFSLNFASMITSSELASNITDTITAIRGQLYISEAAARQILIYNEITSFSDPDP